MKIGISVWNGQVSTVFDFAHELLVVELEGNKEIRRNIIDFGRDLPITKAAKLRQMGVQVLICGAISQPVSNFLNSAGIEVISFVRGRIDEILSAYFSGQLTDQRFLLPGCLPGTRKRRRHGRGFHGGRR